jgi:hypothetical protein
MVDQPMAVLDYDPAWPDRFGRWWTNCSCHCWRPVAEVKGQLAGDQMAADQQRPVPPLPQFRSQFAEQPGDPVLPDVRQADAVNASSARGCGAPPPTPCPARPCGGPVEQRMEPSVRMPGKAHAAAL